MTGDNNGGRGIFYYCQKHYPNAHMEGCSGTTFGEYSLYPVDGESLSCMVTQSEAFKYRRDIVVLEYGVNDASSVCAGNVSMEIVLNTFRKCVDKIRQLFPNCEIVFLRLSDEAMRSEAAGQISYLKDDYLSDVFSVMGVNVSNTNWANRWEWAYKTIVELAELLCDRSISIMNPALISEDGMHPSESGYIDIAQTVHAAL